MRRDVSRHKGAEKHTRREHTTWTRAVRTSSPPRAWTSKTMHHPATRIGEIKHGKS
jgi:hypothetical protein